ncbi:hypothetical protein [Burkholderia sp. D-99]|uniref:hypothetical protein n=1 Tax=Burkholderia sp. D-99 TaxID=2717316 RepID=UPI001420D0F6|nr:hypothetical protein [Burkholderia sp. D-99]NHV28057.1 hypothetical protein [Burkholderia sp. D-99]
MRTEPLFCYPALDDAAYLAHLRAVYEASVPDVSSAGELTPERTIDLAERSVATRAAILTRVYAGDYHTDSFDFDRLAKRVRGAREFIWFWGHRDVIDEWLHDPAPSPQSGDLGTVSVVDSSGEFGPGIGEICRSGSISPVGLKPFAVKRIIDFLTGALPALHESFHTLMLVPRARAAAQGIRGGKSVNTIHRKYIRSRFFGFAPWYVMQGGFLECLEYREISRSLDDVLEGMNASPTLHFANQDDATFAEALFAMNFPSQIDRLRFVTSDGTRNAVRYLLTSQADGAIRQFNHRSFELAGRAQEDLNGIPLSSVDQGAHEVSCTVVHLDLGDPDSVAAQRELHASGYRLTCVRPPRSVASPDGGGRSSVSAYGSWAKPNARWKVIEPYYASRNASDVNDSRVLDHLSAILRDWALVA